MTMGLFMLSFGNNPPVQILIKLMTNYKALSECSTAEGLSILISVLESSIDWKMFKRRVTVRSRRLRGRVDYNEDEDS